MSGVGAYVVAQLANARVVVPQLLDELDECDVGSEVVGGVLLVARAALIARKEARCTRGRCGRRGRHERWC